MTTSKTYNFIGMLIVLFIISVIYTALDNYSNLTAFEFGRLTGQLFRNVLHNLFIFVAIKMVYEKFKTNHQTLNFVYLILAVFILSVVYTFIDSRTNHGTAYQLGYTVGRVFRNLLKTLGIVFISVLYSRKNKTKIFDSL